MKAESLAATWLDRIKIVGGHPAVDFVNTVHSRVEPESRDYLETPVRLIGWCRHVGLIGDAEARALEALAPARGKKLLEEARSLREMLYALFNGYAHGLTHAATLAAFNRELKRLARWREMIPDEHGFAWHYRIVPDHPRSLFAPIVFAAAELLLSPELRRLKACLPPEGCGWLFLDRSRNASRSWCDMETCGNVAKQRRHRARLASGKQFH